MRNIPFQTLVCLALLAMSSDPHAGECSDSCVAVPAEVAKRWEGGTDYPIPIMDQATVALGTSLYSFGGVSTTLVSHAYRFNAGEWSLIAPLPMPLQRMGAASDGTYIYLVGGIDSSQVPHAELYRYDPVENTYTQLASAPTVSWSNGFLHVDGKLYRIAGTRGDSIDTAEVYDIASNTWAPIAPYPERMSYVHVFVHDGFIYGAGGFDYFYNASPKTYRYDPASNIWNDEAIADLPTPRFGGAVGMLNGRPVVAGGYEGNDADDISASVVQWSSMTNRWSALPPLGIARTRMNGAVLSDHMYVIGGRTTGASFAGSTHVESLSDELFRDGFETRLPAR